MIGLKGEKIEFSQISDPQNWKFIQNGKELKDINEKTNVDGSIYCLPRRYGGMQIYVSFPNGKCFAFDCDLDAPFEKLKKKISGKDIISNLKRIKERYPQIPYDMLLVVSKDRCLQELKTLRSQGVEVEAKLKAINLDSCFNEITQKPKMDQSMPTQDQQNVHQELLKKIYEQEQQIQQLQQQSPQNLKMSQQLADTKKLQQQNQQLNNQLVDIQYEYNQFIQQTQLKFNRLQQEMQTVVSQSQEQIQMFERQLENEKQNAEILFDEKRDLKKKLQILTDELEDVKEKLKEKEYELKFCEKKMGDLNKGMEIKQSFKPAKTTTDEPQPVDYLSKATISQLENKIYIQELQSQESSKKIEKQKETIDKLQQQLNNKENDINLIKKQLSDEISKSNQRKQNWEQNQQKYESKIEKLENEKQDLKKDINAQQIQVDEINQKRENLEKEIKLLKQNIESLNRELNEGKSLEQQLKNQLEKEEKEKESVLESKQNIELQNRKKYEELKRTAAQFEAKIAQIELELNNSNNENNQLKQQIQRMKKEYDELKKGFDEMREKMSAERLQLIAKKMRLQKALQDRKRQTQVVLNEIVSPTQAFFQGNLTIMNYLEDPNITTDISEFQVYLLRPKEEEFDKKIFQVSDLDFNSLINYEEITQWKCIRTVNPVAQGDRQQMFLLKIQESKDNKFTDQVFAYKQIKDTEKLTKLEDAITLGIPHLISKHLLDKFISLLKKYMKEKIPEITFQNLYLLEGTQEGSKTYYLCERLVHGEFNKYNGGGLSYNSNQYSELCNAFSFFTYHQSQRQLIVTHMQGVGNYLYDSIVSTEDGLLGEIDLGADEISQFITKAKEIDAKTMGRKYLSALNIKIT